MVIQEGKFGVKLLETANSALVGDMDLERVYFVHSIAHIAVYMSVICEGLCVYLCKY